MRAVAAWPRLVQTPLFMLIDILLSDGWSFFRLDTADLVFQLLDGFSSQWVVAMPARRVTKLVMHPSLKI